MNLIAIIGIFVFHIYTVKAQFAFKVQNTDASDIYQDIQAMWGDWAAAGNQVLASAKADGYTGAWSELTEIYGGTSLPALYNDGMARNAATVLAQVKQTTVWDKNAGDHNGYTFQVRDISMDGGQGTTVIATITSTIHITLSSTVTTSPTTGREPSASSSSDGGVLYTTATTTVLTTINTNTSTKTSSSGSTMLGANTGVILLISMLAALLLNTR
ncbi:hypothetical protein GGI25_000583 [Coemansia spiralis]|uniref:Uncharacterized protein n=2 Tax=Coemansia TaxID=4863 RepID=A0A9W8GBP6_9FUNG|nr:hypothetical protein BX070DRAFT_236689 [Coemansia spiralis]KAJ1996044.1 hypothetical protein EDC05_000412 [Coemansia umbellata]KAJ2625485.1 hypothetical protein GGI26_000625 [Coemansia sp. RSA 1358]KAJ2680610.1 hypothetical protein GGI25_000583 [Coemansia spiralis]